MKAKPKTAVTSRDTPEPTQEHSYSAFDNMLEGIQVLAHDWRYVYLNEAAERHNHRPNQELLGNKYMDMWLGIEDTHVFSLIKRCMEERVTSQLDNRFAYPDGQIGWFNLSIQPIAEGVLILSFDLTERVRAELKIIQMKRLYATLSQVNQIIVRVKDRVELYRAICDVAVQFGEFSLAWIGLLNATTGDVIPVAANGLDVAQWPFDSINLNKGTYKNGLIATAMKTSKVVTSEDLQTDERARSQHEKLEKYDFHSFAAIPFRLRGKTIGVLGLASREAGLFKAEEELCLLDEMQLDISFALDAMETEAERVQAEESLRESEHRFRTLVESGKDEIVVFNAELKPVYMSPSVLRAAEYDWGEMVKAAPFSSVFHEDRPVARDVYDWIIQHPEEYRSYQLRLVRRNGSLRWTDGVAINLLDHPSVRGIVLNYRDITERKQTEEEIQSHTRQLAALLDASRALTESLDLSTVLQKITEKAAEILDLETTAIYLLENEDLYLGATTPPLPPQFPESLRLAPLSDHPHIKEAVVTGLPIILPDTATAELTTAERAASEARSLRTILYVPLKAEKSILGVLILGITREPGVFSKEAIDLSSALSNQAALAVTNAKLYENLARYARDLEDQIAVREQTEEALRQSEERFRMLVDQVSNIAVQGYAADGTVRFWNRASEKIYGYTAEEALGKNLLDLIIPPPMRQAVIEDIGQMVQSGEGRTGEELLLMRKDGSLVPVYSNHTVIEVHGGGKELYCIDIDLTERKQAERALQESERQMRALVTSLDDIVIEFDEEGTYINIWAADENLLARPKDQLLGQRLVTVIGQEVGRQHLEAIQRVLRSGISEIIEYPLTVLGGQRWFMARVSSLSSQNSSHRTVVMLIRDITQRKQSDNELLHQKELLQTIVDNIPVMIEFNDSDGQIRWVNRQWTHILGWSQEEANRRDILSKLYPDAQDYQNVLKFIKTGSGVWADFRTRTKDGQRIDASWANVILSNGTSIGIGQDVTERRLAEQEIQRRNEDLALINALNDAANRGEDIERIAEVFAREAQSVLACQDVALYLLSPDSKYLEMQSSTLPRGLSESIEKLIGRPIPKIQIALREGSYFKKILANEAGVITSDPAVIQHWIEEFTETTFLPHVFRAPIRALIPQIYRLLNISSAISIPLITSGRAIGILDMSSRGQFTEEDLRRVRNLSYQMTAVILRKQAEKQVQLQLQRMRAVNEIDGAINSSMDIRVSLDILLTQVISQLGVHAASVLLFDTSTNTLQNVAAKGFRTADVRQSQTKLGEGLAGRVGLERSVLHVQNPAQAEGQLKRAELIRHEEFVEYVGVPLVAKGVLKGVLEIFHRTSLSPDTEWMNYLRTLGEQAAIAIDNTQLFEGMQRSNLELITAYDATIDGWSRAMDLRDRETEGHTQRVTDLTLSLARAMGISQQELIHIRRGALLHDMGKLGVPDYILHKPGELTAKEWEIMHQHPTFALNMLLPVLYLRPALDIPYCHHEKWDGTGYPRGLRGEQIPLAARIFAVVDVWDALISDRPYRPAGTRKQALEYIKEQSGKHFDPQVVRAFLKIPDIR